MKRAWADVLGRGAVTPGSEGFGVIDGADRLTCGLKRPTRASSGDVVACGGSMVANPTPIAPMRVGQRDGMAWKEANGDGARQGRDEASSCVWPATPDGPVVLWMYLFSIATESKRQN